MPRKDGVITPLRQVQRRELFRLCFEGVNESTLFVSRKVRRRMARSKAKRIWQARTQEEQQ
jgi:hypothetical protein